MFSWFLGSAPAQPAKSTAPEVTVTKVSGDEVPAPPQESAPLFAVNALKTAVFGTPAPAKAAPGSIAFRAAGNPPLQPIFKSLSTDSSEPGAKGIESNGAKRRALTLRPSNLNNGRSTDLFGDTELKDSSNDNFKFKVTNRKTIFDKSTHGLKDSAPKNLFEATPARSASHNPFTTKFTRPASPTKSILSRGAGTSLGPKKAVSFHPSLTDSTPDPKNRRARSGLPHEFPGKFPSPWTPRTGQTPKLGERTTTLDETSKPLLLPTGSKRPFDTIDENTRIENILGNSEPQFDTDTAGVLSDFDAPRSASGQFWVDRSKTFEDLAVTKADKLKERCQTAIEYAKQKDELCVNLAEKLRETLDKNKLLKDELRRIHRWSQPDAHKDQTVLADVMHMLSEKEEKLGAAEEEIAKMKLQIDQYAARVQTFEEMLDHREDKITELSMSLYDGGLSGDSDEQIEQLKQKLEKAKNQAKEVAPLRIQCTSLQSTVNSLKREKSRLETRLSLISSSNTTAASTTALSSNAEARLKERIEELEKARRELRAEMSTKITEASKQRRESEKTLRSEISDLKAKLANEQLDKKELQEQVDQLHAELLGHGRKDRPSLEWQQKHQATVEELRRVKEELDQSKLHNNAEDLFRLHEGASQAFINLEPIQKPTHGPLIDLSPNERGFNRRPSLVRRLSRSPHKSATERKEQHPPSPQFEIDDTFNLPKPSPFIPTPVASQTGPPPKLDFNSKIDAFSLTSPKYTEAGSRAYTKPSPRPSVVAWSPPRARTTTNVARKNPRPSALDNMDPARRAAAERRVAERMAARKAAATGR
ncbi:hypothetical protein EX30DRAFT_398214 [Ascodesmis nigricans]|uniref:Spindle pole body-associated protein cut12 domain-containing protein n=1 Tax=Ascodesmis nigricans TaxID=341454 RepID=A0A4S2MLM3_9PEZI|nr:hypothetical protein EX30DRAFT_398214 [Ascodesmis nigricans]